jgi:hypothetical protein
MALMPEIFVMTMAALMTVMDGSRARLGRDKHTTH